VLLVYTRTDRDLSRETFKSLQEWQCIILWRACANHISQHQVGHTYAISMAATPFPMLMQIEHRNSWKYYDQNRNMLDNLSQLPTPCDRESSRYQSVCYIPRIQTIPTRALLKYTWIHDTIFNTPLGFAFKITEYCLMYIHGRHGPCYRFLTIFHLWNFNSRNCSAKWEEKQYNAISGCHNH